MPSDQSQRHMGSRRCFLGQSVALTLAVGVSRPSVQAAAQPSGDRVTFSFGTYGMPGLRTESALRAIAEIGYDGVELCVQPNWDAAPQKLNPTRRESLRDLLQGLDLRLTAIMEHLIPNADPGQQQSALDRLSRVAELAQDLSPERPPLLQTVLGGGVWADVRGLYRDQLAKWLEVLEPAAVTLAIKPHRGGAMSRPSEAIDLIRELGNPRRLKMVYDYSHYAFRDMPLDETISESLAHTAHVALKDTVQEGSKFRFLLPGESKIYDYSDLLGRFYRGGYRGDFCCEVSSMVSGATNYDPHRAAKTCYQNLSPAFELARVPRG
jgi:sugar phosphate isomerase/epimerase